LELVLALSISVVVIGLVSFATQLQMRAFEKRRDRIEEAALARAILRHISDDLRSAVAYRPVDLEGIATVTGNAADATGLTDPSSAASGNTGQGGSGGQSSNDTTSPMSPGTGTSSSGATSPMSGTSANAQTGETSETEASGTTSSAGAYVAGLYGDQYSIQFDMTRLPRLDEYQSIMLDDGQEAFTQIPTDIRTISFYLAGSTPITQAAAAQARATGMSPTTNAAAMPNALLVPEAKGLVRQERDRSVASYGNVAVDLSDTSRDTGEDLLAEEVTRLEFRYFDGYQWWPSWDSDTRGGLPMAIEILIGLMDRKTTAATPTSLLGVTNTQNVPQELIYRLVVRIPTAEPLDPAEAGVITEEASSESTSTGGSTTASGGVGATSGGS